jgi:hypothetical protein
LAEQEANEGVLIVVGSPLGVKGDRSLRIVNRAAVGRAGEANDILRTIDNDGEQTCNVAAEETHIERI